VRQDNNKLNYSSLVYKWRWGIYQFLKSKWPLDQVGEGVFILGTALLV
jgi:hypothetical protein